ncbi:MAG: hypothetical protein K2Q97_19855, partial [Burkholderiaceae bacterium]|nr:hypothetical protein [Burkholderiaceae bacterium]
LLMAEMDPLGSMTGRTFHAEMPLQSVNASHWYDVTLLVSKQFSPALSVDWLTGVVSRGTAEMGARYQRQLAVIHALAGHVAPGGLPTLISEFGISYDLEEGAAYSAWRRGERGESV